MRFRRSERFRTGSDGLHSEWVPDPSPVPGTPDPAPDPDADGSAEFTRRLLGALSGAQNRAERDDAVDRFIRFIEQFRVPTRARIIGYWLCIIGGRDINGRDATIIKLARALGVNERTVRRHLVAITNDEILGQFLRYISYRSHCGGPGGGVRKDADGEG